MKINKLIKIIYILSIFILILNLTGCNIKTEKEKELEEKVDEEMRYVSNELLNILNSLNNISVKNYSIVSKKTDQNSSSSQSKTSATSEKNEKSDSNSSTGLEGDKRRFISRNDYL